MTGDHTLIQVKKPIAGRKHQSGERYGRRGQTRRDVRKKTAGLGIPRLKGNMMPAATVYFVWHFRQRALLVLATLRNGVFALSCTE